MVQRIPEYFGIDGRALPPAVKNFGAKKRTEQAEDFQEYLEEETRKLKERSAKT